ncbi:MAG: pyridoxamine 5'-phosphate oxidase family protein [Bacillota bacterium]
MKEVYEFLKKCETYYLATVEGDQPRVRPLGTVNIFDGKLYIQTGKVKNVSKQMQANPKIEICAFNGDQWIRVSANVIRDDRVEAKQDMLDAYPGLKERNYKADDDNTEVLYLKDATATIYSFTTEPRVIKF